MLFVCLEKEEHLQCLQLKQLQLRNTFVQTSKNTVTIYIVRTNTVAAMN